MKKKASFILSSRFLKNSSGSAAVFILSILPLFFLIFTSFSMTGYLIQLKSRVRATCVQQSIAIQKEIIGFEKKLFALNPLSTLLRARMILAVAELAAASGNPIAVAIALEKINSIRNQQEKLDLTQKSLIKTAQFKSQLATYQLLSNIKNHFQDMGRFWKFYLSATNALFISQHPQIAVEPDFDDLAPNYGLKADYKTTQQLVLSWHHSYRTNKNAQQILSSANRFEFSCGAGPNQKGKQWSVEIKGDKF